MPKDPAKHLFHLATEADIKAGEVHDVYFSRTVQILRQRGDTKRAKAEIRLKSLPRGDWRWGILAGIEEVAALLGLLCQASGIATKAARCKKAAGERQVISFGARRMHPAVAPMIERNAFVGGCDGVAKALGKDLYAVRLDTPSPMPRC